ncbi:inovirus Gp2 family protein [Klebsiella michiganensis]|uniref:inovirus Gp2 family protein n=1 Tax=Klebsiella michiganensis TaxID=1134687 RepID=UPI00224693B8|nr:inovirus Gp2 family protein [Klebsiella michiganensis]MCW9642042.1 inovirus Gp2 family protein [Klebsiella michiganensis]
MNNDTLNEILQSKIVQNYGSLNPIYVDRIFETINKALNDYPRVLAVRLDLRLPDEDLSDCPTNYNPDAEVITRFIASVKAQIKANIKHRKKAGKRTFPCTLRYVWVRELNAEGKKHYHVLLLINRDAYLGLGGYGGTSRIEDKSEGLASMFFKAWISATGLEDMKYKGLVYFPYQGCYHLFRNGHYFKKEYTALMKRGLYLAKERSKSNEDGWRNLGCSQN